MSIRTSVLVMCFPFVVTAQHFKWETKLENVKTSGYQKILLVPDVTAQLRNDFTDIRIYDKDFYETPYLLYKDEAKQGLDRFVTYQVTDVQYSNGCCSYIKVKNSTGNPIDHIVLEVNNADAQRAMNLSGSYDGNRWFTVRDQFVVETFNTMVKGEKKTTSLLRFNFPLTDYKFYKFEFDDWHYWWRDYKYPVFVVRAGHVEPTFVPERCLELPKPVFEQKDTLKQTLVHFGFAEDEYVDHIKFSLHQVKNKDYYRSASLYEVMPALKGKTEERFIASTVLSSLNDNEITLGGRKGGSFVLKINNEDDRALVLDDIRALQVKHYLVADLEAGNAYIIRFGNDTLPAPVYDLQYFKSKIPDSLEVVNVLDRIDISKSEQKVNLVANSASAENTKGTFFTNKTMIWFAIGGVGILLLFMASRMLRDMKEK